MIAPASPGARKRWEKCVRMARFVRIQRTALDAKIRRLADEEGWDVDRTRERIMAEAAK